MARSRMAILSDHGAMRRGLSLNFPEQGNAGTWESGKKPKKRGGAARVEIGAPPIGKTAVGKSAPRTLDLKTGTWTEASAPPVVRLPKPPGKLKRNLWNLRKSQITNGLIVA